MEFQQFDGKCKYCGKIQMILAADQQDADQKVMESCSCGGWKLEKQTQKAYDVIRRTCGDLIEDVDFNQVDTDTYKHIASSVDLVISEDIKKVSFDLFDSVLTISTGPKGEIKINRAFKKELNFEV